MAMSLTALAGALAAAVAVGMLAARFARGVRPLMAAAATTLALAAAGPRVLVDHGAPTVHLVDISWSTGLDGPGSPGSPPSAGDAVEAAGVVLFGAVPATLPAGAGPAEWEATVRRAGRAGSDAAAGLRAAGALLPDGGLVVLATDGRVDERQTAEAGLALASRGIRVRVAPRGRPRAEEVWLGHLAVPGRVAPGAPASGTLAVAGPPGAIAVVALRLDGAGVEERAVPLPPSGRATVRFDLPASGPGWHAVTASLRPPAGATENDRLEAGFVVGGPPRVLLVNASALAPALRAAGCEVEEQLRDLGAFDLVVLRDLPAHVLPDGGAGVSEFVAAGGGLAVLGGPSSFGPGGWQGTPLEACLPVTCAPAGEGFLAIVLLDRSGTMAEPFAGPGGTPKVLAARSAAQRLVAALPADARVLFVPFTAELPPQVAEQDLATEDGRQRISQALARLTQAGGGTALRPPLLLAAEAAGRAGRSKVLCLLVTDGRLEGENADDVLEAAAAVRRTGARLSVLAVGRDADESFLARLAGEATVARVGGGGELEEAFLAALREAEGEGRILVGRREVRRGEAPGAADLPLPPPVEGLVRTWARPEGAVLLSAGQDLPLVALRRFGLGRTLAVTTDPLSDWAPGWEADGLLLRLLSMVRRPAAMAGPRAEVEEADGRLRIRVDLPGAEAGVDGALERPGRPGVALRFTPAGDGRLEASCAWPGPGPARLRLSSAAGDADVGVGIPYPSEFAASGPDENRLARLTAAIGEGATPAAPARDARAATGLVALALLVLDRILFAGRNRLKRAGRPVR